jgi:hypothetical protein
MVSLLTGQLVMLEKNIVAKIVSDTFTLTGIACQLNTGELAKNAPTRVSTKTNPNIFPANSSIANPNIDLLRLAKHGENSKQNLNSNYQNPKQR